MRTDPSLKASRLVGALTREAELLVLGGAASSAFGAKFVTGWTGNVGQKVLLNMNMGKVVTYSSGSVVEGFLVGSAWITVNGASKWETYDDITSFGGR